MSKERGPEEWSTIGSQQIHSRLQTQILPPCQASDILDWKTDLRDSVERLKPQLLCQAGVERFGHVSLWFEDNGANNAGNNKP